MEPIRVDRVLSDFVAAARESLGDSLVSVVLYGSAAENALRPVSDVNVIVVLSRFDPAQADALREPLRAAHAAARLTAMFLLESEIFPAAEAFAEKFADILRRRKVLHGSDPFAAVVIPRPALLRRLEQSLLNLALRLREAYVSRSLEEREAERAVAEAAGPLRSSAASLLALEGKPAPTPKEALVRVAASLPEDGWGAVLANLSTAREKRTLAPGDAQRTLLKLADLACLLHERARRLK